MDKFIKNIWQRYQQTRNIDLRNILIEEYLPIVSYHAGNIATGTPSEVQHDDLYSDGVLGLISAVKHFDPDKNIKFETFAAHRVRGQIKDGLRKRDYVPRQVRIRHNQFARQIEAIQQNLGYAPHEDELRKRMRISRAEFAKRSKDHGRIAGKLSISNPRFESDSNRDTTFSETLADRHCDVPTITSRRDFAKSRIMRGLSRENKLILTLYYCDGMSQKEIGQTIGISESRVSQMHKSLLERLRSSGSKVRNMNANCYGG